MAAYHRIYGVISLHLICGLTACTPGSAPGPMLGNEYRTTFCLFNVSLVIVLPVSYLKQPITDEFIGIANICDGVRRGSGFGGGFGRGGGGSGMSSYETMTPRTCK